MSSLPAKSQPLHNFSLPHLKWTNHRNTRPKPAAESSSSPPPPHNNNIHPLNNLSRRPSPLHKNQSPVLDHEPEPDTDHVVSAPKHSSKPTTENPTNPTHPTKPTRSNKICIRFRKNDENRTAVGPSAGEEDEESPKIWNLRPRRLPMPDNNNNNNNKGCNGSKHAKEISEVKNKDDINRMTRKFSIALTREEIEEDMFLITGSKASRRPKKRPRTVQRQLDAVFPGLWLGSVTADSYKVSMDG